jgi:hypothetical protein
MTGGEGAQLGPIRPEHAVNGWRLEGDDNGSWCLVKHVGRARGKIRPATAQAVSWTIYGMDGALIREASERYVAVAMANAETWLTRCSS